MSPEDRERLVRLLRETRWAALATARDNEPFASWVAIVPTVGFDGFLLHLSRLALHTRYLLTNPRAALTLCEPDRGADPQQLARVSLPGSAAVLARGSREHDAARARYLARFPEAAPTFELGDFELWLFVPAYARYVSGFGRAYRLTPEELRALA